MEVVRRRAAVRGGRDRHTDRGRDGNGEEGGGRDRPRKPRNMLRTEFDTHKQACRFALGKVAFPEEQMQICCLLGQH